MTTALLIAVAFGFFIGLAAGMILWEWISSVDRNKAGQP